MQKWEYREEYYDWVTYPAAETEPGEILNELGQEGWELVAMIEDETGRTMYLKRPLAE